MTVTRLPQRATFHRLCFVHMAALMCVALFAHPRAAHAQAKLVLVPGSSIGTLAGSGADARTVAGVATVAALGSPQGVAYDAAGNLYVADSKNHQVTRTDTAGQLTVVAGTGAQGFAGDGSAAVAAELNGPIGVAVDSAGNLYIADTGNHRVRRVDAEGLIATVVGNGVAGVAGDGGPGVSASLRGPAALVLDASGALLIADAGNHRIRKLQRNGTLITVVGSGSEGDNGDGGSALAASLEQPSGLTVLSDGRVLIADRAARRVRVLNTDGTIAAYAVGSNLTLRSPGGLAVDGSGTVYAADSGNSQVVQGGVDGGSVLAGLSGEQGALTPGGPTATALNAPAFVAARFDGSLAVSDRLNHQVQRITQTTLAFGSVPVGKSSAVQILTLQDGGTSPLQVLNVTVPAGFATTSIGSCGASPFPLQPAATCTLALTFSPTAQGAAAATGQVRVAGSAASEFFLTGTGVAGGGLANSITALQSNGSISYAGAPVSLTATVAGSLLNAPTGNVTFYDNANAFSTIALAAGKANVATNAMQSGAHTMRAIYSGDAVYGTSSSPGTTVTVVPAPDFTLSASAGSYSGTLGGSITVPMTLLPVNGTLNHVIQLAVTGLPAGATATFLPATLTLGGDSVPLTLTVKLPTTTGRIGPSLSGRNLPLCAVLVGTLLLYRRRSAAALLCLGLCVPLLLSGCGSGFKAGVTQNDLTGTHSYTTVVTATTTGVLGSSLAHSASVGLVVTP